MRMGKAIMEIFIIDFTTTFDINLFSQLKLCHNEKNVVETMQT